MKKESKINTVSNHRKGISLVVLVITILVMVIIAVAVIMGLANTNSIQKAKEANLKNEIANMLDKQSERYNELYIEKDGRRDQIKDEDFGDIVPGDFEDRFEASKDGIIYNGEDEEEKKIAEEMGCIIPGKDDGGGSGGEGTNENISKYVSINDLLLNASTDTITIQTIVTGNRNDISFYHYQTRIKGQEVWDELKSPESKVEIKNLKANTMYEVRVEVTDRENKKASSQVKEIATKDFGMPEIAASTTEWTNQAVEVRIRYQNQEMINEFAYQEAGPWTPVKDTLLTLKVKENTKVYARSKDKAGNVKTSELEIKNIDTLAPNKIQIVKTTGINSITVKASTSDKGATATSGMSGIKGYAFSKDNGRSFSEYNTTGEYVFDNLSFGESYLFQVKAIDNAGNETIEEIDTGTITYPAPTFSAVPSGWTNQNVSVTIHFQELDGITKQYSRDAKNWITYTEPVIFEENGVLYARIIDNTGKISKVTSFAVTKIDKEAPIATVTPDGGSYTIPTDGSVAKIKAKISAQDLGGSGVREIKYAFSTNKTTAPSNWKVVQNNVEFTQEGLSKATYYLWVNITDNAGNQMLKVVTNNIYKITDKTDAINKITLTSANTNYTNQDVNVIVKYGSNLVQNKKAGIQGGTLTANAGNVVVKENGTVYAEAEDMAGNKIYTTLAVGNIDKLPPTTTISPNGGNYTIPTAGNKAIIKARITASDTGVSGLNLVQYAWSTSNTTEPTSWINYTAGGQDISTTSGVGNMYLWTKVTDKAGSRAETIKVSNAYTVTANTAVENLITLTPNTTDWTNQDVTVTVKFGANLSQNRKAEVEGITIANPTVVTLTKNGVVYVEATDIAGNKITKTLQITKIDKNPPTTTISPNGGKYTIPTSGNKAIIKARITASDTGVSGLNLVQYAWSTSNTEEPTSWTNFAAGGQDISTTSGVGNMYLWTKVTDKAGSRAENIKVSNAYTVTANTAVENLITLTPNTTDWTNQNVIVTIKYGSNLTQNKKAGIQGETLGNNATSVTVVQNGVVYAEATDIGGNKITKTLQITKIDKVQPTSMANPNGGNYTIPTGGSVATLKTRITANDVGGSGLNLVQYAWSTSNTTEPTSWTSFTAGGQDISTTAGTGTRYLWTKVTDRAGNRAESIKVSQPYYIKANTASENVITLTPSTTSWTNQNITVTVGYGSNISQNRKAGMQGGTLVINATTVTVRGNGVVYAEATDIGGNKITKTLQITNIDKTNPNTTSPSVTGTTNSLTATLRQTDSGGSGLNNSLTQYAIKKNGGSWGAWQASNSFTGLAQGTLYQVKTRVKDIAGNGYIESLVTNYTTASVQSGEGKISVSLSPSGWTNGNVTVTITYPAVSGLKAQYHNGSSWSDVGSIGAAKTHQVTITGNTTVYARYVDSTGQAGANKTITIGNIDKSKPNGAKISNVPGRIVDNANFSVTVSLSDVGASGINTGASKYILSTTAGAFGVSSSTWNSATAIGATSKSITLKASSTSMKYLHVLSVDNAGNKTESIYTFNIQASEPTINTVSTNKSFSLILPVNSTTALGLKNHGENYTSNVDSYQSYVTATVIKIDDAQNITFGSTVTVTSGNTGCGYGTLYGCRLTDNRVMIYGDSRKYDTPNAYYNGNPTVAVIEINGTTPTCVATNVINYQSSSKYTAIPSGIAPINSGTVKVSYHTSTNDDYRTVTQINISGNSISYSVLEDKAYGKSCSGDLENKAGFAFENSNSNFVEYSCTNLGSGIGVQLATFDSNNDAQLRIIRNGNNTILSSSLDEKNITHFGNDKIAIAYQERNLNSTSLADKFFYYVKFNTVNLSNNTVNTVKSIKTSYKVDAMAPIHNNLALGINYGRYSGEPTVSTLYKINY